MTKLQLNKETLGRLQGHQDEPLNGYPWSDRSDCCPDIREEVTDRVDPEDKA
jgi:hypothetical protein